MSDIKHYLGVTERDLFKNIYNYRDLLEKKKVSTKLKTNVKYRDQKLTLT